MAEPLFYVVMESTFRVMYCARLWNFRHKFRHKSKKVRFPEYHAANSGWGYVIPFE
jgi:hypothetical protein